MVPCDCRSTNITTSVGRAVLGCSIPVTLQGRQKRRLKRSVGLPMTCHSTTPDVNAEYRALGNSSSGGAHGPQNGKSPGMAGAMMGMMSALGIKSARFNDSGRLGSESGRLKEEEEEEEEDNGPSMPATPRVQNEMEGARLAHRLAVASAASGGAATPASVTVTIDPMR